LKIRGEIRKFETRCSHSGELLSGGGCLIVIPTGPRQGSSIVIPPRAHGYGRAASKVDERLLSGRMCLVCWVPRWSGGTGVEIGVKLHHHRYQNIKRKMIILDIGTSYMHGRILYITCFWSSPCPLRPPISPRCARHSLLWSLPASSGPWLSSRTASSTMYQSTQPEVNGLKG
jgi:hypothetical protein